MAAKKKATAGSASVAGTLAKRHARAATASLMQAVEEIQRIVDQSKDPIASARAAGIASELAARGWISAEDALNTLTSDPGPRF